MVKPHVNFEEYVSKMENSLKEKVVIVPYIVGKTVIDFGAGSGGLGTYLKSLDPTLTVYAIENDNAMIQLLQQNPSIDKVFTCFEDVPKADTIIFNSVLHEVFSYSDKGKEKSSVLSVLQEATNNLNSGGRIIIRDGFKANGGTTTVKIKRPTEFDIERYIKQYRFGKPITFNSTTNEVKGRFNDVKEFLNKLTWGMKSLDREICEQINCIPLGSRYGYEHFMKQVGLSPRVVKSYPQTSYFSYLDKVAEIKEIWDTHALIVAEKP